MASPDQVALVHATISRDKTASREARAADCLAFLGRKTRDLTIHAKGDADHPHTTSQKTDVRLLGPIRAVASHEDLFSTKYEYPHAIDLRETPARYRRREIAVGIAEPGRAVDLYSGNMEWMWTPPSASTHIRKRSDDGTDIENFTLDTHSSSGEDVTSPVSRRRRYYGGGDESKTKPITTPGLHPPTLPLPSSGDCDMARLLPSSGDGEMALCLTRGIPPRTATPARGGTHM